MAIAEALAKELKVYERLVGEKEAGRKAEYEHNRVRFYTSIECAHDDKQHLEVMEFTLILCFDCAAKIMWAINKDSANNHDK